MPKRCSALLLAATVAAASSSSTTAPEPDWGAIVDRVNADPKSTWVAGAVEPRQRGRLYAALGPGRGTLPYPAGKPLPPTKLASAYAAAALPSDFDARTRWPNCPTIAAVRDQGACGSCFAFGAIEAFEDRICIHLGMNVSLSAGDIISCHDDENMSCDGGNPIAVWQDIFAGSSSGDGAIRSSCYPYGLPRVPCNHHSPQNASKYPACPAEGALPTPTCDLMAKFKCEDKGGSFFSKAPTLIAAANMEQELVQNGPITVAYTVYDDFLAYKSGVYQKSAGAKALGGHSVKIVGYGVDAGVKYWTVANSWNEEWGDGGFFKIVRGTDECYIESSAVVAGIPRKQGP